MSGRNPTYTNPIPCKHLAEYKQKHGLSGFNSLEKYLKTSPNRRTTMKSKDQTHIPKCSICSGFQGRLYFCLICSSVSCCHPPESNHAFLHAKTENGHEIAVDMERAELFCCVCCDQVYDPDFDKAVMSKQMRERPSKSNGVVIVGEEKEKEKENSCKRRKVVGSENYSKNQNQLVLNMRRGLSNSNSSNSNSSFPWGLRGLNNLGSTCFMNSVLQAFLHTPPLRNYFLVDHHDKENCMKSSLNRLCLRCEIEAIFSAAYSGEWKPFSPARFLFSWWQHSENLASYEQQDAHEFFISVLDRIHEKEEKAKSQNKDNGDCHCIAHRAFAGLLRSDCTCTTCGSISTTFDPCMDISLDFESTEAGEKLSAKSNQNVAVSTLLGCLDLFTRPEKLGSDQKLFCEHCDVKRDTLKQMSIKRLPLVLCFHIKRFEHSPVRKMSRKLDRYLQFPFSLDMAPYLSSSIVRNRFGNRIFAFEGDESDISPEFEVFAVITHSGKLESGHYVTYLRLKNQWYKCDDAWITQVSEGVVRASQGYMMYYVQKSLYCKASEDLSCLPQSPRREPFFPTLECC